MNLTRREAIKSILSVAAVATTPNIVKAALKPAQTTLTERILKDFDYLFWRLEELRCEKYDEVMDDLALFIPKVADKDEISARIFKKRPKVKSNFYILNREYDNADVTTLVVGRNRNQDGSYPDRRHLRNVHSGVVKYDTNGKPTYLLDDVEIEVGALIEPLPLYE